MRCTVKPAAFRMPSRNLSAPPTAGVTERQRSRSRAMASGSADMTRVRLSIPQQLVDAGLRPRALADALDAHRTVEPGAAALAGHGAGHHHGIGRHFALQNLAACAIDDLGRGAE